MANGITNFDISALLGNPTFQSFMSRAGSGIAGPNDPFTSALDPLNQQLIGAKNMKELLSKIMAGGGKMNLDKDKFSLNAPSSVLSDMFAGGQGTKDLSIAPAPAPSATIGPTLLGPATTPDVGVSPEVPAGDFRKNPFNPSPSPPDVRNVDLAGLTPGDVAGAFGLGLTADQIRQAGIAETSKARLREAQITKALRPEKDTAAVETYKFAQRQGFKGSIKEFKTQTTGHKKDYDEAKAGGYKGSFNDWMLAMAQAGAINLGEFTARKEAAVDVKQRAYFTSADFSSDVDKAVLARRSEYEASDDPAKAKSKIRFEEMDKVVK